MSIINFAAGAILGVAAGTIAAVLPNANSDTAVSIVGIVGGFLGVEPEIAIECALGTSMLLGTVKEVQRPELAATAVTISPATAIEELATVEPTYLTAELVKAKVGAMGVGVLAGFILTPAFAVVKPVMAVAFVIGAFSVLKARGCPTQKALWSVVGFFLLITAAWWLGTFFNIANPVIAISTCGFYLPGLFAKLKNDIAVHKGTAKPKFNTNLLGMLIASVAALFAPAVNTNHVTKKATANDFVTGSALEVFFESFGVGMAANGYTGSKFYSSIVLGVITPSTLVIAFAVCIAACCLLPLCSKWFLSIPNPRVIAGIISLATLISTCGIGALAFIPLGLVINYVGAELRSFTYFSMLM